MHVVIFLERRTLGENFRIVSTPFISYFSWMFIVFWFAVCFYVADENILALITLFYLTANIKLQTFITFIVWVVNERFPEVCESKCRYFDSQTSGNLQWNGSRNQDETEQEKKIFGRT